MKRILFFTHHLTSGGAEKAVRTLATYMNAHCDGYQAMVCVVYDAPEERARLEQNGVPVFVMRHRSSAGDTRFYKGCNVIRQIREFHRIKRDNQIDVCISFLSGADIINVLSRVGEKEIVSIRSEESRFVNNILQKWYRKIAYLKCDRIIAVSRRAEIDTVRYFGIDAAKVTSIPNAIQDASAIATNDPHYLSFIDGKYVYINVARLFHAKGQDVLLRAFSKVHKRYPETVLALIGGGPEEVALKSLAEELEISNFVYFAGMQQNPDWYMRRADAFVLSSNAEGMPNAVLEAMRARLPVISTDCGAREILAPETDPLLQTDRMDVAHYGILTPVGDDKIMAEAMIYILEHQDKADQYRSNDAVRIKDYSMESVMSRWIHEIDML